MLAISEQAHKSALNDDELTRVFNEIDDDGNGYITPREAKKAFKKLADKFNISRVSLQPFSYLYRTFLCVVCYYSTNEYYKKIA